MSELESIVSEGALRETELSSEHARKRLNATRGDIVVGLRMSRLVSWAMLITLLMNVFALAFFVHSARAARTIYIRADGSIDPPTASIFSVDNVTYIFTDNITNDSIVVERDSIIIDGAGYTLQGTEDYESRGIDLTGRNNVTVKNTNIKSFGYGIWLEVSSNNSISENSITANNYYGISLSNSSNYNSISRNSIAANIVGISLSNSSNNSLSGNNITNNDVGISLRYSSYNSISGNSIAANIVGISLHYSSSYNSLSGNNITANNRDGIFLSASSSYNSISGNNITNNGIGVFFVRSSSYNSLSGNNITKNGDGIYLSTSSSYNSISGNSIAANNNGISLDFSSNNSLSGNNIANNDGGISLFHSSNNSISGNTITNNRRGMDLYSSSNNSISRNSLTANDLHGILLYYSSNYNNVSGNNIAANNEYGVWLDFFSSYNSISGNNITNNWRGIHLYRSSNYNNISGNSITDNDDGIFLDSSSSNLIYHNNFINNTIQVESFASQNFWDNGYPSGGNYWSDYSGTDFYNGPYQNETGSDGIGDTPYIIDENNTDHYPLMNPYVIPEFPLLLILPLFMIATLLAVIAHRKKRIDRSLRSQKKTEMARRRTS